VRNHPGYPVAQHGPPGVPSVEIGFNAEEECKKMGEPVVLPKFELHGDKQHWAVKLAWISGIVLIVAVVGLGALVMHHNRLELEAHVAREEAIARVKAEADAKIATAVAVARAQREAELAEKRAIADRAAAEKAAKAAALASVAGSAGAPADAADGGKPGKGGRSLHRSHSGHGAKLTKIAKADVKGGTGSSGGLSSTGGMKDLSTGGKSSGKGKPDPIDDLLKKMK
jgi:uncharacterized membrane protein YgcG